MKSTRLMPPLRKIAYGLLGSAAIFGAATFFYMTVIKINFPYMLNLGEPSLYQATHYLAKGINPYYALDKPPYTLVPYGPVYLVLTALLNSWFLNPFFAGRLLTLGATVFCAFFIWTILRKSGVQKRFAFFSSILFLAHPYILRWGVQVNVDMLGVFFDLLALLFFLRHETGDKRNNVYLHLGILWGLLAFFTKSSMISAPAAYFFYSLTRKEWKRALFLLVTMAAGALLIYALMYFWTSGHYYLHTTYEISKRRLFPVFIYRYWWSNILESPILFLVLWAGLAWELLRKKSLIGFYLLVTLLSTLSLAKQGSDTNYFLSSCAALFLVLGCWMSLSSKKEWMVLISALLLAGQAVCWILPHANWTREKTGFEKSRQFNDQLSKIIKRVRGDILSEDMSLLVANGREIFYEPFPMGQMSYSGVWDEELILKELRAKRFSLVLLYFYAPLLRANRNFTVNFMETFNANYAFLGRAAPDPLATRVTGIEAIFLYIRKGDTGA